MRNPTPDSPCGCLIGLLALVVSAVVSVAVMVVLFQWFL